MTIVYPPSLVGEYQFRLSEWAPQLAPLLSVPSHPLIRDLPVFTSPDPRKPPQFCPIYRIRSAADPFGCAMANGESLRLPWEIDQMVEKKGVVEEQVRIKVVFYLWISLKRCVVCNITVLFYLLLSSIDPF